MVEGMRICEPAGATGVSVRALRYDEQQGLLAPHRRTNGYREYEERAAVRVRNIRMLLDGA